MYRSTAVRYWLSFTLFYCCSLAFPSGLSAQTFYKTYTSPNTPSQVVDVEATADGFQLSSKGFLFQPTESSQFVNIFTDEQGNKIDESNISFPIGFGFRRNLLQLSNETYIIVQDAPSGEPAALIFTQYNAAGNLIHEFEIAIGDGIILARPALLELPNGNLYIITGYSEEDLIGPPDQRHFIYAEYDLDNQEFVFINDILWSTSTISASVIQMKLTPDGKVVAHYYEDDFANRHYIIKQEIDGTEIWRAQVSTLERPPTDFVITPEGGVWYWIEFFNQARYINPDGTLGSFFDVSSFQNSIQSAANIKGLAATSDNGVLIIGTASPQQIGGPAVFTALVGNDGTTEQSHFFELQGNLPTFFKGFQRTAGDFVFAGGINTQEIGLTPFLLRLDSNGNLPEVVGVPDLNLDITGSTVVPNIWNFHSITLTLDNEGTAPMTDIVISVPKTAGSVYEGGNEWTADTGSFDLFAEEWSIDALAAGASISLTINYFRVSEENFFQYAQVSAAGQTDFDSEPGNGDGINIVEDDEVAYGNASSLDFFLSFITAPIEAAAIGSQLEFTYSASASFPLDPFDAEVTTGFYLSADNTLSADDILITQDVHVFDGTFLSNKEIIVTISNTIVPGDYFLIGRIDDLEEYTEPDETNNSGFSTSSFERLIITPPTNGQPDLVSTRPFYSNPTDGYEIGDNLLGGSVDLYNTGEPASGAIQIGYYLSTDQSLSNDDILVGQREFGPTQILHFSPQFTSAPTQTIPAGTPGGDYWVLINIDSNDDITESTESNNVRFSNQQVTINGTGNPCTNDNIPPVISGCPNDISRTTGGTGVEVQWTPPMATDNCTNATLISNFAPGNTFSIGSTTVVYTAVDGAGNMSTCSFVVTVTEQNTGGCSNNLLTNGGFENGLNGWNDRGGGSISTDAYAGSQSLQVCQGTESRVIQGIPVVGGQSYTFEFTGKNDVGGVTFTGNAFVKFLTTSFQPLPINEFISIPPNWQTISNTYVAPANAAYAEINFQASGSACIFIDEVCFGSGVGVPTCAINIVTSNVQCQNNGTPNDPSDDTFTFDFLVNGSNAGNEWTVGVTNPPAGVVGTGAYEVTIVQGPFPISEGPVTIGVRPNDIIPNNFCNDAVTVQAPTPCSGGSGQQADLTLSNLNAPASAESGEVINFSFDLNNIGNGDASGSFSIKAYYSTDEVLDNDDIFDGIIPTGNLGAGLTVNNVPGASTVPNDLASGNYFLILKVDADDQIDESDENNNTVISAFNIDNGGSNPANCTATSAFPWHDWIAQVKVGNTLDQNSGKSTYSDFTNPPFTLVKGQSNNLELTTGFSYFTYDEYYRIWVDLDQNGAFDANEKLYEGILNAPANGTPSQTLNGQLTIPTSAANGTAKMRVIMSRGSYANACGAIDFGEVEDYMVNVVNSGPAPTPPLAPSVAPLMGTALSNSTFKVYPNPANDWLTINLGEYQERIRSIRLVDALGQVVYQQQNNDEVGPSHLDIDLSQQINGQYFLILQGQEMKTLTKRILIQRPY